MSTNCVNAVRNIYAAFARGEFPRAALDPHVEWIEPDAPDLWFSGRRHGADAVITEVMQPTAERFDDFRLQCYEFLDAGDRVVVAGRFLGRAKETGIELDAAFIHIWTLRDEKVVRFQGCSDTANFLYALYRIQIEHPTGV